MRTAAALVVCWLTALPSLPANAQAPIERVHIIEHGVYRAETVKRQDAAKGGMIINTVQNPRLISNTTTILAAVGVRFGLRYTTTASTELRLVIRFPPGGLRDPVTQQVSFQSEFTVVSAPRATNYWEYHFEHDWEVAPGQWIFEFWLNDKKLVEQRFCVYELNNLYAAAAAMIGKCQSGMLQDGR